MPPEGKIYSHIWAIGAAGSAGALHAQGRGFESLIAHQMISHRLDSFYRIGSFFFNVEIDIACPNRGMAYPKLI